MKKVVFLLMAVLVFNFLLADIVSASELNINGELKQILDYGFDNKELIQADSKYRIVLSKKLGFDGDLYLSLKGDYDTLENRGDIKLDEAYTAIYFPTTDLVIGKQIINWGTADGINPTNNINPVDINSFTDGKLTGEPVLAARTTHYGNSIDLTGVLVFDFVPQDLTELSSYLGEEGALLNNLETESVKNNLKNMEYALKAERRVGNYDVKLSYYHGWGDLPGIIKVNLDPDNFQPNFTTLRGSYQQVDKYGLAVAGAISSVGFWGEMAYVKPDKQALTTADPTEVTLKTAMNQPYYQVIVGSDYTFNNGIYAEGQYIYYENGSLFNPYHNPAVKDEDVKAAQYIMGRASYDFNANNRIELTTLINLEDNSVLVMPVYIRALTAVTDLKISPIIPLGEDDGELKMIPGQLKVSIETSF